MWPSLSSIAAIAVLLLILAAGWLIIGSAGTSRERADLLPFGLGQASRWISFALGQLLMVLAFVALGIARMLAKLPAYSPREFVSHVAVAILAMTGIAVAIYMLNRLVNGRAAMV